MMINVLHNGYRYNRYYIYTYIYIYIYIYIYTYIYIYIYIWVSWFCLDQWWISWWFDQAWWYRWYFFRGWTNQDLDSKSQFWVESPSIRGDLRFRARPSISWGLLWHGTDYYLIHPIGTMAQILLCLLLVV